MKVEAVFSDGMTRLLDGAAIGDEFNVTAKARITAAEETLVCVTGYGAPDEEFAQADLHVKLLLSHPRKAKS